MSDPYYSDTALALNFEGADASTTFTDVSQTPKTPSVAGNAQIDTAQFVSGSASMLLDGTGDYIQYASHADFDFGTGDFCVECWWRPAASAGANYQLIGLNTSNPAATTDQCFSLRQDAAGKAYGYFYSGTTLYAVVGTTIMLAGTWYHLAFRRASGVIGIYVNGLLEASLTAAASVNTPASRVLRIGTYSTGTPIAANGHIDGARITKHARYTSNFGSDLPSDLFAAPDPGEADADLVSPFGTLVAGTGSQAAFDGSMGTLVVLTGVQAVLSGRMGTFLASAHDATDERQFLGVAPAGLLVARTGAGARLSPSAGAALVTSITVPVSVRANLVGPRGTVSASATVTVSVQADIRLTGRGTLVAQCGARASMRGPAGLLQAVATAGALTRFTGTSTVGELLARASAGIVVTADLTAPMLMAAPNARARLTAPAGVLVAFARSVIEVTYEAYAINLKPGNKAGVHEVTRYTGQPFTGIVRWRGDYYGWGPGGLYLIGGATDYDADVPATPAAIPWNWMTTVTDFGSSQRKAMRQMTVGGRLGDRASASVSIGKASDFTYRYATAKGERAQNYRVKFGKGLDDRYYSIGLSGTGIGDVDTIDFDVEPLSRK